MRWRLCQWQLRWTFRSAWQAAFGPQRRLSGLHERYWRTRYWRTWCRTWWSLGWSHWQPPSRTAVTHGWHAGTCRWTAKPNGNLSVLHNSRTPRLLRRQSTFDWPVVSRRSRPANYKKADEIPLGNERDFCCAYSCLSTWSTRTKV